MARRRRQRGTESPSQTEATTPAEQAESSANVNPEATDILSNIANLITSMEARLETKLSQTAETMESKLSTAVTEMGRKIAQNNEELRIEFRETKKAATGMNRFDSLQSLNSLTGRRAGLLLNEQQDRLGDAGDLPMGVNANAEQNGAEIRFLEGDHELFRNRREHSNNVRSSAPQQSVLREHSTLFTEAAQQYVPHGTKTDDNHPIPAHAGGAVSDGNRTCEQVPGALQQQTRHETIPSMNHAQVPSALRIEAEPFRPPPPSPVPLQLPMSVNPEWNQMPFALTPLSDSRLGSTRIARFNGKNRNVDAKSWITVYASLPQTLSDQQRITHLVGFLDEDALSWYAEEVCSQTLTWDDVVRRFLSRFATSAIPSAVAAEQRRMGREDTVFTYSRDKMRLLRKTGMKEADMVSLLTAGCPSSYRTQLYAHNPKTYEDWLRIAAAIENAETLSNRQRYRPREQLHVIDKRQFKRTKPNYDKPSAPCRYCKNNGKTEYHWHRDCPRRTQSSKTTTDVTQARQDSLLVDSTPNGQAISQSEVNSMNDNRLIYMKAVINGIKVNGFVDTGATISVMSWTLAHALNLTPIPGTSKSLTFAGTLGQSAGYVVVDVTIGRITESIRVHVIDNFRHEFLLGVNEGGLFKLVPILESKTLTQVIDGHSELVNNVINDIPDDDDPVFSQSKTDLGRITVAKHCIRVKDGALPISLRPYRQSSAKNEFIRTEIADMLKSGIIRPSISPWSFPVTVAPKSNGELRFCVDYRRLNEITITEHTPLPIISEMLENVARSKYYSVMDLAAGYWQIPLDESSIEKSSFVTTEGQYEYLVMPFGLKNAPSTFQRIIKNVLRPFAGKGVENYLDDIVVHTTTIDDHRTLLTQVIDTLRSHNVKLKRKKCVFYATEISLLGHRVSYGRIEPNADKVKAVQDFPTPTTRKQLQQFNGLANYYRKHIKDFSKTAAPLYKLLKKTEDFVWGQEQENAFTALKKALTEAPVLAAFDATKPCKLQTDGSALGLGAILSQMQDGAERVIAYYSKKLSDAESRYTAAELECFAVVSAIKHFRIYLEGQRFELYTDCSALQWLFKVKDTNGRLFRWSQLLSPYEYTTHYRPGVTNQAADALSRNPVFFIDSYSNYANELQNYTVSLPTTMIDGYTYVNVQGTKKLLVPPSLQQQVLTKTHDEQGHPGINRTKRILSEKFWWPRWTHSVVNYVASCHTCQITRPLNRPALGNLQPIETPYAPNETWAMDTIVIGSDANNTAAKFVQVIVDHHSRYVWAKATKRNTAEAAISALKQAIDEGGPPQKLIVDNGSNFRSNRFKNFATQNGIKLAFTSTYHPQSNGLCERTNGTIVRHIVLHLIENPRIRWSSALIPAVNDYNRLPHTSTGFAPESLHFGRNIPDGCSLSDIRSKALEASRKTQTFRKLRYDESHAPSSFNIGEKVLALVPNNHPGQRKFSPRWDGPYTITDKTGPETYRIQRHSTNEVQAALLPNEFSAHSSRLRLYIERSTVVSTITDDTSDVPFNPACIGFGKAPLSNSPLRGRSLEGGG